MLTCYLGYKPSPWSLFKILFPYLYKQNNAFHHQLILVPDQKFKATVRPELVRDFEFVKENGKRADPVPILEARGLALSLNNGERGDLGDKSVPCAKWTPLAKLFDSDKRIIRSPSEIEEFFSSRDIDLDREPVTTCGRGVSASVLSFCIYYATGKNAPVYDGSWFEWKHRISS